MMKMSPKGQLVVPQDLREQLNLKPGDRFVPVAIADGIYFKKVDLNKEFLRIAKDVEKQFVNLTEQDIKQAIQWARKQSS